MRKLGSMEFLDINEYEKGDTLLEKGVFIGTRENVNGEFCCFYEFSDKSEVAIGGNALLMIMNNEAQIGDVVQIVYLGKVKLKSGKMAGKPCHKFEVSLWDDEELSEKEIAMATKFAGKKAEASTKSKASKAHDDDEDDEDDEDDVRSSRKSKSSSSKKNASKRPKYRDDEDDEDEDEDEAPRKKKKSAPVEDDEDEAPRKKKKSKPVEDDEDEDEAPRKKKKSKPVEDDEDEDEAPRKKKKSKPVTKVSDIDDIDDCLE